MSSLNTIPVRRPPGEYEIRGRRLWPTMIFTRAWKDYPAHREGLIEHLLTLRDRETANIASGVAISSKPEWGLFESRMDLFDNAEHAALRAVIGFLDETLRQAISLANDKRAHPNQVRVRFCDSWFHVTNTVGFTMRTTMAAARGAGFSMCGRELCPQRSRHTHRTA